MSNEEPPAWAHTLLQRISTLEQRLQESPLLNSDPNVTVRTPGADFTPTAAMLAEFTYIEEDFFNRPLQESDRRRFLFDCPKNSLREYDPPKLNKVNLNPPYKQVDSTLYNLQYRISGLTRPLDWFSYQMLHGNWDHDTLKQQAHDFTFAMHELLSDLASHITTLRTENMFKGLPNNVDPPALSSDKFLVDTQDMLDHIKLQKSIQNATQRQRRNNGPRSKNFSHPNGETNNSVRHKSQPNYTNQTSSPGYQSNQASGSSSHGQANQQQGFQRGPNQRNRS